MLNKIKDNELLRNDLAILNLGCSAHIIGLNTNASLVPNYHTGPNRLDFHFAFRAGRLTAGSKSSGRDIGVFLLSISGLGFNML